MPRAASDCLKLASGIAAKVLIYISVNELAPAEEIAAATGVLPEDAADALAFWERAGVLIKIGDTKKADRLTEKSTARKNYEDEKTPYRKDYANEKTPNRRGYAADKATELANYAADKSPSRRKYSPEKPTEIAKAAKVNSGIGDVFIAAEKILGRVLRPTEIRVFTALLEELNISPDILIMIIDFAVSRGRYSANYIDTTARDWNARGVLTHTEAETEILRLGDFFTLEGQIKSQFGLNRSLTKSEREQIKIWADLGFPVEMIMIAFDSAVEHTGKVQFRYITKILSGWKDNAVKTASDIARTVEKREKSNNTPSFDYTNRRDNILDKIIEEAEEVTA